MIHVHSFPPVASRIKKNGRQSKHSLYKEFFPSYSCKRIREGVPSKEFVVCGDLQSTILPLRQGTRARHRIRLLFCQTNRLAYANTTNNNTLQYFLTTSEFALTDFFYL